MTTRFTPQNDLERQFLAAQEGCIPPEDFIRTLLGSEVFMPIFEKHQIGGLQTGGTTAQPLKLTSDDGAEVLVLFTSPERAKAFVKDFPGYGGGLVTEFTWILDKLGIGYAVSLNPDQEVGMDFETQDVAQMAALHGQAH
jgi:hypothetical protein